MSRWPAAAPPLAPEPEAAVLFLDRDGVLIHERDYLSDPAGVELLPGTTAALGRARAAGFRLVGISNQSGLGRGRFAEVDLDAVMQRLDSLLRGAGCPLDAFFYCPHAPRDGCACRKPGTGLLAEAAAAGLTWDRARSRVIGDKISDVELARAGGMTGILVRTGHGADEARRLPADADVMVVDDLAAAVATILEGA